MNNRYLFCVSAFLCLLSCSPSSEKQPSSDEKIVPAKMDDAAATAKMASLIAESYAKIDHTKATFLVSNKRVEYFKQLGTTTDLGARISAWISYANELLNVGETEQAIVELTTLQDQLKNIRMPDEATLTMRRTLAMAYLRLGEEANCISTRNHASCIIPIAPEGRYQMTSGSESAMKESLDILKKFPEDYETMWILNLAAMTIGEYPAGVPKQWRVPEKALRSNVNFPKFQDVSHQVGIKGADLAGGTCVEDFDGDGWLDILVSSWGPADPLVFWRNTGQGTFENASAGMGLKGITGGLNITHADINNDGLADVFITRGAWMRDQGRIPNSLLLNLGNGKFADITISAGVLTYAATQAVTFADFNLDGWIDFFVGNESGPGYEYTNEFYLNNRDNTFRNVINEIGVNTQGFIKGCIAGDINNDGWPDIYVSTFPGKNMLLLHKGLNAQGVPQFENISYAAGTEEPEMSFPTWMWDYDNDGWQDIFVSAYGQGSLETAKEFVQNAKGEKLAAHPHVFHNKGNNSFEDVSAKMGMTENIYTMGCNYGDLDADGYLDFYLGTGAPEYSSAVPNKMFRNNAGKHFDDITYAGGFGHIQKGHGVSFGDFDRDGDEDIFESLGGAFDGDVYEDILYKNPIGQDQSWVVLQLVGNKSNRMAIGARVTIHLITPNGARSLYRIVNTGGSFGSSSLQLEVGLGNATSVESIEVQWPNEAKTKEIFRNIPLKKYVRIVEGTQVPEVLDVSATTFRD